MVRKIVHFKSVQFCPILPFALDRCSAQISKMKPGKIGDEEYDFYYSQLTKLTNVYLGGKGSASQ